MQEDFQITIVVVAGSILLISLVFFIILSSIMYQKARSKHEQNFQSLKSKFEKEILQVNIEVRQSTLNKVSEEIHDNVGQVLSLIKLNLHQLQKNLNKEYVDNSMDLVNTAISGLRNIAHIISSDHTKTDLFSLFSKEVNQLNRTGVIHAELTIADSVGDEIDPEITLIVYRMVQEIINNVIKHAHAKNIKIDVTQEIKKISITIEDDGQGFDVNRKFSESNGIKNLKRRAKIINSKLTIASTIGRGTVIRIEIEKS